MENGTQRPCWCGNDKLQRFLEDYRLCDQCGSLVTAEPPGPTVRHLELYAGGYWQRNTERARHDLPERCLYWLRTLLRYRLPPGKTLEIGCAHGGFVALLRWAGFDSTGLELDSGVAGFAREAFRVPVLEGAIEVQDVDARSLDVIVLMDVLEHLPDPESTVRHCRGLLKPDGLLLIQTPEFQPDVRPDQLEERSPGFSRMLAPKVHLHLHSRRSVEELFRRVGIGHLRFEPAIFHTHDMLLVASASPLRVYEADEVANSLLKTPEGRLILALLDSDQRRIDLESKYRKSEADRAARLRVIEDQARIIEEIDADRNRLRAAAAGSSAEPSPMAEELALADSGPASRHGHWLLRVIRRIGSVRAK